MSTDEDWKGQLEERSLGLIPEVELVTGTDLNSRLQTTETDSGFHKQRRNPLERWSLAGSSLHL